MKRRNKSAGAVRAAASAAIALEKLELRRLLSGGYQLDKTIIDSDGGYAYENFGRAIATQGTLALIGSTGEATSITHDGGNSYEDIDTTSGRVSLIDTTTGDVLHTFNDPIPNPPTGTEFGAAVAFVDGKIAISAPGAVKVFIYNDYSDDIPDREYSFGTDSFTLYGSSMAVTGDDLLVSAAQANTTTNNGQILKYDLDSASPNPVATISNPDAGVGTADLFGYVMAADDSHIYARAQNNGEADVEVMDTSGNLLTTYHGQPGDFQFGTAMTSYHDANAGDTVIISSPSASAAYQVDASGNTLQTFLMPVPVPGSVGVATSLAISGDKLIAGDPGKPTPDGVDGDGNPVVNITGAAYVFDIASGNYETTIENPNQGDIFNSDLFDQYDSFGANVAGLPNGGILVSAPNANNVNGIDAGTIYTYTKVAAPVNQPPTADAGATQTITEGQTATLDASGSTDPDGAADIVSYSWDLNNDNVYGDAGGVTTTFSPDHPGSYTINVKVTDSVGHESTASTTVNVNDVLPTANAGGSQSGTEGVGIALHGSGNNTAGDAIVGYAWDLDNNGSFETSGQNISFNPDLPGVYTVGLKVTDDDGQTATSSASLTINDVAPTANAGGNQTVTTGTTVNFNGTGSSAPGDAVTLAWDFNYSGNPAAFNVNATGANASASYATAGNRVVALRVTDDDGQSVISTLTVTVNNPPNHAPSSLAIAGPTAAVGQQAISLSGSYVDTDAGDSQQVSWNFGDGSTIAYHATTDSGALAPSHAYLANGTYTVTMSIRDSFGATASVQSSVVVSTTLQSGGNLYIGGTTGTDKISITKATGGVNANMAGVNKFYAVTGKVIIYGGDGNDSIQANADVPVAFEIYGGGGNDTIKAGMGNDIFVGGPGNDQITGDAGRDILIGGIGQDQLTSNGDDDILIAGTTSFDNDPVSLRAISAEWSSTRIVSQRIANIRNGSGSPTRLNGNVFLQADVTVFDDAIADTLQSGSGNDWLFANNDLGVKDKTDATSSDVVTDVDIVAI